MVLKKLNRKFGEVSNIKIEDRKIKFETKDRNLKKRVKMSVDIKDFVDEI